MIFSYSKPQIIAVHLPNNSFMQVWVRNIYRNVQRQIYTRIDSFIIKKGIITVRDHNLYILDSWKVLRPYSLNLY